jgi:hypothetical protein
MATNKNDRSGSNLPGQHPTGAWDQGHEQVHPSGERRSYGQDKDATNLNRDQQHVNAANQPVEGQTPDPSHKGRDGQHPKTGSDESRRNQEEPNRKDVYPVIPEVPLREEEREQKTPEADKKITNSQGNDRFKKNTIDDSSKFSE